MDELHPLIVQLVAKDFAESSSIGEILSACIFEMGKVATCHLSLEKGMLQRGFLLRQSFWEVTERRRLCLPEEQLPYSGSVKDPLGMDLDPVSPKADAVSLVDSAVASGSVVMLVASVAWVKHFSFTPVLEDAPTYSAHAKVPSIPKSSIVFRREAI
jgi:hypothetical protein